VTNTTVFRRPFPQFQKLLVELVADDFIERAERLVHQQQLGIEGQRARDRHALLHAARQLPGKLLLETAKVHEVEIALHPFRRIADAHDLQRQATLLSTVRHGNRPGA
jgi:hypothetical protein